jgi:hypothetical protein
MINTFYSIWRSFNTFGGQFRFRKKRLLSWNIFSICKYVLTTLWNSVTLIIVKNNKFKIDCATSSGKWRSLAGGGSQNSEKETEMGKDNQIQKSSRSRGAPEAAPEAAPDSHPEAALSGKNDVRHGHATAS